MAASKDKLPSVMLRSEAGKLLLEGKSPQAVANMLGLSIQTTKRYQALVAKGGLDALAQISVGGRTPSLNADAWKWIASALRGSPAAHGFNSDQWTDGRLQTVIEKEFGRKFSRVYVRQIIIDLGCADRLRRRRNVLTESGPGILKSEVVSWVSTALIHSPRVQGFEADRWTNERLRAAIERHYGVRYSRVYVWKIATELGLSHLLSKMRR